LRSCGSQYWQSPAGSDDVVEVARCGGRWRLGLATAGEVNLVLEGVHLPREASKPAARASHQERGRNRATEHADQEREDQQEGQRDSLGTEMPGQLRAQFEDDVDVGVGILKIEEAARDTHEGADYEPLDQLELVHRQPSPGTDPSARKDSLLEVSPN
jgi:hypothetical protein